jgi:hypothetical protein
LALNPHHPFQQTILAHPAALVFCYDPHRDPEDADMNSQPRTAAAERAAQLHHAGKLPPAARA